MEILLIILLIVTTILCILVTIAWRNVRINYSLALTAAHYAVYITHYQDAGEFEIDVGMEGFLRVAKLENTLENKQLVRNMTNDILQNVKNVREGWLSFLRMNKELNKIEGQK